MISQLDDFSGLAQSGQELSRESLWPAEIQFTGQTRLIACSGGNFADSKPELAAGGFFPEYAAGFRVRRALLLPALPEVGMTLQWRRPGEPAWRQTLRIMRVADPASDAAVVLGCEEVAKPS